MEASEIAKRRILSIARHLRFMKEEEENHELCSSSLAASVCSAVSGIISSNSRKDNMLFYARQGSDYQGVFMRIGKQALFTSERNLEASQPVHGSSCSPSAAKAKTQKYEDSSFTGEATIESSRSNESSSQALDRSPLFARMVNDGKDKAKSTSELPVQWNSLEWNPHMDIVESGSTYVITIELPGVNAYGIRVEVKDNSVIVTGTRSTEWWSSANKINGISVYHRKELAQGRYRAVWHIPDNSNSDLITAEYVDGFLRVIIPKATT